MYWVWYKFSATFESTSRQSRVARQSLSNLIQQSNLKEILIQTSSYRRAKVEVNWSIEFDTTIARHLNWVLELVNGVKPKRNTFLHQDTWVCRILNFDGLINWHWCDIPLLADPRYLQPSTFPADLFYSSNSNLSRHDAPVAEQVSINWFITNL